jgi:hypothetical protein
MSDDAEQTAVTIEAARELLISYERLDGAWRRQLSLSADQKLIVAFLAARGAATPEQLERWTCLQTGEVDAAVSALVDLGYLVRPTTSTLDLVQLAKSGFVARMTFDAVFDDLAAAAAEPGGSDTAAITRFLTQAVGIFDRHAEQAEPESWSRD